MIILQAISAEYLILGLFYISSVATFRILGRRSALIHIAGTCILGMWFSTAAFHLMIALDSFSLPTAILTVTIAIGILRATDHTFSFAFAPVVVLLRASTKIWRVLEKSNWRWVLFVFSLFLFIAFFRLLILPPLGWDSITYHLVKAGMWVQKGSLTLLEIPGGWNLYRNFSGGGEVFTAWALLPFRSDILAGVVDFVQWLTLGLMLYALGTEIRIRLPYRLAGVAYVLFLPVVWHSIGCGYVDLALNASLVGGLLFSLYFWRSGDSRFLMIGLLSLGLSAGIKLNGLTTSVFLVATLTLLVVFYRRNVKTFALSLLIGSIAAAAVVAPWLIQSYQETGYPLSPFPLSIGGLTLGVANPPMRWYLDRPLLQPYELAREWKALTMMFDSLSFLTLFPLVAFLPAFRNLWRTNRAAAILILSFVLSILIALYAPGFTVVRLRWAKTCSRFVVPLLCVVVMLSIRWPRTRAMPARILLWFMIAASLIHLTFHSYYGWRPFFYEWAPFEGMAIVAGGIVLIVTITILRRMAFSPRSRILMSLALIAFVLLPIIKNYRGTIRYAALKDSILMHSFPGYWIDAAQVLDDRSMHRIAVTGGPFQDTDNLLLYFFMGNQLQNRLFFVPFTTDGRIIDLIPGMTLSVDFDAWFRRLQEENISEVVSFQPPSLELSWMLARPEYFQKLAGDNQWGVFRLRVQAK